MILLVDIGNSRIKWCLDKDGTLIEGRKNVHNGTLYSKDLDDFWGELDPPVAVWGVNVSHQQNAVTIEHWCREHWSIEPNFVGATAKTCGVINGYRYPEQLGPDRWVAMIGAMYLYSGACCIVDCGTAVTIDCLDDLKHHLGGLILPGLSLMPRCVIANTARLVNSPEQMELWGRDTGSCLAAGALHAIVATLQRASELLHHQLSKPVTCILTGGDAEQILPLLDERWVYVPDLVFIGLSRLITEQRSK